MACLREQASRELAAANVLIRGGRRKEENPLTCGQIFWVQRWRRFRETTKELVRRMAFRALIEHQHAISVEEKNASCTRLWTFRMVQLWKRRSMESQKHPWGQHFTAQGRATLNGLSTPRKTGNFDLFWLPPVLM
jgi:hypothetical protein